LSSGASHQTPPGELTALPQTFKLYLENLPLKEREMRRGKGERNRTGEEERRRGGGREFDLCPGKKKKEKSAPIWLYI